MPADHARHGDPGDIIVMAIPGGFMLGRVLPDLGPGPWWEYIKVASDQDAAMKEARSMADQANVHAWVNRHGHEYAPIPPVPES